VRRVGEDLGIAVPDELVAALGPHEGDEVNLRLTERSVEITSAERDFERAMQIARECADEYRKALAILAQS
jgi:antitoxin component of MazEF toxin-antitoxin module